MGKSRGTAPDGGSGVLLGVEAVDDHGAALLLRVGRAGRQEDSGSSPEQPGHQGGDNDVVEVVPGMELLFHVPKRSVGDGYSEVPGSIGLMVIELCYRRDAA